MGCPTVVHETMLECWLLDRRQRITFDALLLKLKSLLKLSRDTPAGLKVDPKNAVPAATAAAKTAKAAAVAAAGRGSNLPEYEEPLQGNGTGADYSVANNMEEHHDQKTSNYAAP